MPSHHPRAKIFISCGQSKISDEVEIAHRIAERILSLGFEPYVAVEEQSLRGVKENIFSQLETSEYFIFIDFKREKIIRDGEDIFRGSLFSHQELALASYLDIPLLSFQEHGVKKDDGLLRFLQGNCIPFSDRHLLPSVVSDEISRREWSSGWKNALYLDRDPKQYSDAKIQDGRLCRFFHIDVKNLHQRKTALNCYAYLEKVYDVQNKKDISIRTVEFKWAGYVIPYASIMPKSFRSIDAFFVSHVAPTQMMFNIYTDSSQFVPRIIGPGEYDFTYLVVSENFLPVSRKFRITVGNTLADISLVLAKE